VQIPTFNIMRSSKGPHRDPFVLEHAVQPKLWIIGALAVSFWMWTIIAAAKSSPPPASIDIQDDILPGSDNRSSKGPKLLPIEIKTKKNAPKTTSSASLTLWIVPYLKTPLRKIIAMIVYLGILSLQLLEGYWIVVTFMPMDIWTFYHFWPALAPIWIQSIYTL
jgi:hypothetical protein